MMTETDKKPVEDGQPTVDDQQAAAVPEAAQEVPVKEMKAVVLTGYGGLKSVRVQKKPEPLILDGQVLIRVRAGGLNFSDLMMRQGAIDNQPKTPFILGFECAGEIEAVGEGVEGLAVGDRVSAFAETGAWAELVVVPAKHVYKIPSPMSFNDAVAVTMNFAVAQALVFDIGNLRNGQTVLVHSAGGGVGQAIVQLARTIANVVVIGTASSHKHEAIKSSVDHIIDHSVDYALEVQKISPEGVDLVLDCLCGDDTSKSYNLLKPLGRYVLYGSNFIVAGETKSFFSFAKSWWQVDKISPLKLFDENKTLSGFNFRRLLYQQDHHVYVRALVQNAYKLYEQKKISPVIDSTWAYDDIAEAMQKMHDRKNVGKIILDPAQEPKPRPVEDEKNNKRKSTSKEKSVDDDKKDDVEKEASASKTEEK